jgi:hypothetical protein
MRKNNHPWRASMTLGALTLDPVVSTRSGQFAVYLETLPLVERQHIEMAERVFVTRTNWVTGPQQSAARDYAKGMLGVKENEPADYRGFVV